MSRDAPPTICGPGPVVLVDDDEIDIRLARMIHERSDIENDFLAFGDGPSFLAHLDACIDGGVLPSMVLLDINMPKMDGFQVLESMRARDEFREIPVTMFYSNSDDPRDRDRAARNGTILKQKLIGLDEGIAFFNSLIPARTG